MTKQGGPSPSGFMLLVATDAVDPKPVVFLVDTGSGIVRGPWGTGTPVKYTQAPGGPPSETQSPSGDSSPLPQGLGVARPNVRLETSRARPAPCELAHDH